MTATATRPTGSSAAPAPAPEVKRPRRNLTGYWLLLPGALWLLVFFVVPFYSLLATSLYDPKGSVLEGYDMSWAFGNYVTAIQEYWRPLVRSLWYGTVATAICLVLGYVLAYAIAFKAGRWRNLLLGLVMVPFFTSFLLRTIAWQSLFADNGPILAVIEALRLGGPMDAIGITTDGKIINTPTAVIGGLTYNFLPFALLPIYVSLEKIPTNLFDAASDLYAPFASTFRRVILPMSLPGV